MAGHQMTKVAYTRDAAGGFDPHYTLLEKTLANPCSDDCLTVRVGHRNIALNLFFEPSFSHIEIIACNDSAIFDSGIN
jgi:hypothetical protein